MPTILLKKSDTPGSVPGTANLTNLAGGVEVAVNTADKRVYSMTSASAVIELGTNPSSLTCSDVSATVLRAGSATITNLLATTLTVSGGTANGVLYLNGSKVATSGSALTFDGTSVTFGSTAQRIIADMSNATVSNRFAFQTSTTNGNTQVNAIPNGSSTTSQFIAYNSSDPNNASSIQMAALSTAIRLLAGQTGTGTYLPITFWTNGVEQARLDTSGTFRVKGAGTAGSTDAVQFDGAAPASTLILNSSGNLGIGTSSPTFAVGGGLHIANASAANVRLQDTTTNVYTNIWQADNGSSSSFLIDVDPTSAGSGGTNLVINTAGSTKLTLNSAGNLGLGVTPSAWASNSWKAIEANYGESLVFDLNNINTLIVTNAYNDGSWKYKGTAAAAYYQVGTGTHTWYNAPSGTAGNNISFGDAKMTLDASGNLLVGGTSQSGTANREAVFSANKFGLAIIDTTAQTTGVGGALNLGGNYRSAGDAQAFVRIEAAKENATDGNYAYAMAFSTTPNGGTFSERARITSGGDFGIGNTNPLYRLTVDKNTTSALAFFTNSNASVPNGLYIDFSAASPDNNTQYFFVAEDSTAVRCYIYSDGDLANHDGVYGTISDERLKQDIVDAGSQWDDLKSIRFRKYRMKTDVEANPDAPAMFGVVAQELAQVCPGLVDEHPNMKTVEVTDEEGNVTQTQEPDGTTTMTVKSSILLMKAAKALQEAMARIESLEAKVSALEAQ